MTEQAPMKITDPDNAPITFCNEVGNVGFLNGVLNITFTAARFTPDGTQIVPDMVVASRLRMDLQCAMQLQNLLGQIIEANTTKPKAGLN